MYTAIAIFVSVPENIGQDCLKKWFCHKLVIFLEKINISYVLLLIHEVNVVSTLKGYMWSHFLLVMEKWPRPARSCCKADMPIWSCIHSNVRYLRSATSYGAYFCCLH